MFFSFNATISSCEKTGQWQPALCLFEAMPAAKIQPDIISFNASISSFEKGQGWQLALNLFHTMPKSQVQPDLVSHSAVISACHRGSQWQQALIFLEGYKALVGRAHHKSRHLAKMHMIGGCLMSSNCSAHHPWLLFVADLQISTREDVEFAAKQPTLIISYLPFLQETIGTPSFNGLTFRLHVCWNVLEIKCI